MADYIETLLEEKSRGTSSEILFTQWLLARDYVPKVQSVIIRTFPHYSLHDSTHSKTILSCIVRILGKRAIERLGPVDLWLLLTASYYHDLGMAPSGEAIEKTFKDDDFRFFVKKCQENKSHPLHPFASVFDIREDGIHYKDVVLSGSNYDGAHYLIAEYIRQSHAEKSEESLLMDESVHLAGNPIPDRLLELLGRICRTHTKDFEKVMSLPYSEVGMGMDDCHPRFIACMLRLGDLLDLDNNRFSDVLLRTLPAIPKDSLLHKKKHLSIKHLRIDTEKIEVTSRTKSYDVADITNRWLEMISDEFRRQREAWKDIVPPGFTEYLPSIGELKVDLIGYDTIDGKKRPGFEIDSSKAIELLQGSGLYSSPAQCMRELLQNAVDATYLSIFLENQLDNPKELETVDGFMKLCLNKAIKVSIDNKGIEGKDVIWHVCIEDHGIGMNKADLGYLVRTGSKNEGKTHLIEKMPEFMRPSGTFGIGFQSVFLITDKVDIKTRKQDCPEEVTAELFNPAGPRNGAVLVKTEPSVKPHGTCLEFDFKADKDLDHWSVSSGQTYSMYTVYSYDFVADKTLNLETARLLDEIATFSRTCPIPLSVSINGESLSLTRNEVPKYDYYSQSEGLQLSISPDERQIALFYRNQIVQKPGIEIPFISVSVNLLSGNAKDLLTLNRNELQYQARHIVKARIHRALAEFFKSWPEKIPVNVRPLVSMFLNNVYGAHIQEYQGLKDEWENYLFSYFVYDQQKLFHWDYSFGEIIGKAKGKPVVWMYAEAETRSGVEVKDGCVLIKIPQYDTDAISFLKRKIFAEHIYPSNSIEKYVPGKKGILFSETPIEPIVDWLSWLNEYLRNANYGRTLMPCNSEYQALRLRQDASFLFAYDSTFGVSPYPKMICPYVREIQPHDWHPRVNKLIWDDADGDLYTMTYDNRADSAVTIDDIRSAYFRLRESLDPMVNELQKKEKA